MFFSSIDFGQTISTSALFPTLIDWFLEIKFLIVFVRTFDDDYRVRPQCNAISQIKVDVVKPDVQCMETPLRAPLRDSGCRPT